MRIEQNKLLTGTKSIRRQALTETPDVRAEKVALGKALVADPNYPSREQIKKIANLLAANWQRATQLPEASTLGLEPQDRTRRHAARPHACVRGNRRGMHSSGRTA